MLGDEDALGYSPGCPVPPSSRAQSFAEAGSGMAPSLLARVCCLWAEDDWLLPALYS